MKYSEECLLCITKEVSAKQMFTNGLNYSKKNRKMFFNEDRPDLQTGFLRKTCVNDVAI